MSDKLPSDLALLVVEWNINIDLEETVDIFSVNYTKSRIEFR
jgi:hypothetical protein